MARLRPIARLGLAPAALIASSGCASLASLTRGEFEPAPPAALMSRIQRAPGPDAKPTHFAVLIGANTELRHRGNLSLAYQVLLEQGYAREHVFIFDSEGKTPFFPLTDFTTREAIRLVFEHLAHVVEPQDTLLVYVTGHGRRVVADEVSENGAETLGVSTLILNPGEEMARAELDALLARVEPAAGIVFFDQCYWGPSPPLCNYVTITTAGDDQTSSGVSFPRAFWRAFRDPVLGAQPTVMQAFMQAMVQDPATRDGQNRPHISYRCVDPGRLLVTGVVRPRSETGRTAAREGPFDPTVKPTLPEH